MLRAFFLPFLLGICWDQTHATIQKRQTNQNAPMDLSNIAQQASSSVFKNIGQTLPNVFGGVNFAPMPPMQPFAPFSTINTNNNNNNGDQANVTASSRETRQVVQDEFRLPNQSSASSNATLVGNQTTVAIVTNATAVQPNGSVNATVISVETQHNASDGSINGTLTITPNTTVVVPSGNVSTTARSANGNNVTGIQIPPSPFPPADYTRSATLNASASFPDISSTTSSPVSISTGNATSSGPANMSVVLVHEGSLTVNPTAGSLNISAPSNGSQGAAVIQNATALLQSELTTEEPVGEPVSETTAILNARGSSVTPVPVIPSTERALNISFASSSLLDLAAETSTLPTALAPVNSSLTPVNTTSVSLRLPTNTSAAVSVNNTSVLVQIPLNASSSVSVHIPTVLSGNATADLPSISTSSNRSGIALSSNTVAPSAEASSTEELLSTTAEPNATTESSDIATLATTEEPSENTTALGMTSTISTEFPLESMVNATTEATTTGNGSYTALLPEDLVSTTTTATVESSTHIAWGNLSHNLSTGNGSSNASHASLMSASDAELDENTGYLSQHPTSGPSKSELAVESHEENLLNLTRAPDLNAADLDGNLTRLVQSFSSVASVPEGANKSSMTNGTVGEVPELPSDFVGSASQSGWSLPKELNSDGTVPSRLMAVLSANKGWDAAKLEELRKRARAQKVLSVPNATIVVLTATTDRPSTISNFALARDEAENAFVKSASSSKAAYVPRDAEDEQKFWSILRLPIVRRNRMQMPSAVFTSVRDLPVSSFSCNDVGQPGYYADPETECQAFHRCDVDGNHYRYICPQRTLFSQLTLVCDHWYNVNCPEQIKYADYINSRAYDFKQYRRFQGRSLQARGIPVFLKGSEDAGIFNITSKNNPVTNQRLGTLESVPVSGTASPNLNSSLSSVDDNFLLAS